ncbi:TetR/AcrR family transcriptional regulator [Paenibacillus agricola]|uniref:TetR/AcrR family transcriptional regulator n=1 Tax=Paenibacillus agricola TaxID=2716264 RepID=A0ABX0JCV5_9BACL|nr:TetR/AcrR family transcriptional regulator [Paenibacillus agricola]NHN33079.1 TetR/AcrR family transcriptional regulator [Paenibacillus agricola]
MNNKKELLVQAAIKLFGERDYHSTSVQDIVSLAGVSKGAFYQQFQSKEELLVFIFNHNYYEKVRNELHMVTQNQLLSPTERIMKGIEIQCQIVLENKDFLAMMIKGVAFTEKTISEAMTRETISYVHWFRERIEEQYGSDSDIKPHSMDLASILAGSLKEFFFYHIFCDYAVNPVVLSQYLIERLEDLVEGIIRRQNTARQTTPMLRASELRLNPDVVPVKTFASSVEEIMEWIQQHIADPHKLEEMLRSLQAVADEMDKQPCNPTIIQGMYVYLLSLAKDDKSLIYQLEQAFSLRKP